MDPRSLRDVVALRVLVPLDGSDVTFQALDRALAMLRGTPGLRLTLFNVVAEGFDDANEDMVERFDEDEDDEVFPTEEAGRRMLKEAEAICRRHDVQAVTQVVKGKVVQSILDACSGHDMLVMHSLGRSQLRSTLRGSQTEKLARQAGVSVLLVHTG